ncbi:MAG: hypothetical protein ACREXX_12010, partial [Gammaproteobacteria bacterium]
QARRDPLQLLAVLLVREAQPAQALANSSTILASMILASVGRGPGAVAVSSSKRPSRKPSHAANRDQMPLRGARVSEAGDSDTASKGETGASGPAAAPETVGPDADPAGPGATDTARRPDGSRTGPRHPP